MEERLFVLMSSDHYGISNNIKDFLHECGELLCEDSIRMASDSYLEREYLYNCLKSNVCKYYYYNKKKGAYEFGILQKEFKDDEARECSSAAKRIKFCMTDQNYKMVMYYFLARDEFYKIIIQISHYNFLEHEFIKGLKSIIKDFGISNLLFTHLDSSNLRRMGIAINLFTNQTISDEIMLSQCPNIEIEDSLEKFRNADNNYIIFRTSDNLNKDVKKTPETQAETEVRDEKISPFTVLNDIQDKNISFSKTKSKETVELTENTDSSEQMMESKIKKPDYSVNEICLTEDLSPKKPYLDVAKETIVSAEKNTAVYRNRNWRVIKVTDTENSISIPDSMDRVKGYQVMDNDSYDT